MAIVGARMVGRSLVEGLILVGLKLLEAVLEVVGSMLMKVPGGNSLVVKVADSMSAVLVLVEVSLIRVLLLVLESSELLSGSTCSLVVGLMTTLVLKGTSSVFRMMTGLFSKVPSITAISSLLSNHS